MAYFNNLDIEIQNQKMEDRKKREKMGKKIIEQMIEKIKLSKKKELGKFLDDFYPERMPDFYKGAEAAFEFLWNDIERRIKETMGI